MSCVVFHAMPSHSLANALSYNLVNTDGAETSPPREKMLRVFKGQRESALLWNDKRVISYAVVLSYALGS